MSKNTMSFALPEAMRAYISARVTGGAYGNTSEFIRDLVRKDQAEQAKLRLRDAIQDGMSSGQAQPSTDAEDAELMDIARGSID